MVTDARLAEKAKYESAYTSAHYSMGRPRQLDAITDLTRAMPRGNRKSYLDVSTGRGEMLGHAKNLGYERVQGTEMVDELLGENVVQAFVHDLPFADNEFQVASLFDVIEHLLPGDDEAACKELARVASDVVILTANNKPSRNAQGDDLHINIRPYPEWDQCFRAWFPGAEVNWVGKRNYVSETWVIRL